MGYHNFALTGYYGEAALDYQEVLDSTLKMGEELLPMMADITDRLHAYRKAGKNIMFEGRRALCWISTWVPIRM